MKYQLHYCLILILFITSKVWAQTSPQPYGAIPSERQIRWHEMEMYCLIHFTPTTFQNKEWGFGDADPIIFNPIKFDAHQIANAAASAGFKGLISVAKHHDGFCLWPTKTTDYSIKSSPWKEGEGDMVAEFMQATHKAGMSFGVYLSAWDRNDIRYGTSAYADAYRDQLTELMTGYGELFTSWHDGANGGDGYYGGKSEKRTIDRTTYYEWEDKTWPIVREYQPMAMIFSDIGPDMRWVGNEHGFAAETSWSTITPKGVEGRKPVPGDLDDRNLTTGDRGGKYWIPAECDVPQRPGWFYHPEQDLKVKTPDQLFEIYLKSVGRGANMNLGLAPMPEGVLHEYDVRSLRAFGEKIKETFADNLAKGAKITASNIRENHREFGVNNMLDDDRYTYYASDDHVLNPILEITLTKDLEFDLIRLRENIKLGQRLDSVKIDLLEDGSWRHLALATSIGANRLIKLDQPVIARKLRVQLFAPVAPTLSDFALFKEAKSNFLLNTEDTDLITLPKKEYQIEGLENPGHATDQDPYTVSVAQDYDKGITFSTSASIQVIKYLPRQDGEPDGLALKYTIYGSKDKVAWIKIKDGEFSNIIANPIEQIITLDQHNSFEYIKFIPTEVVGEKFIVAEFNLLTRESK